MPARAATTVAPAVFALTVRLALALALEARFICGAVAAGTVAAVVPALFLVAVRNARTGGSLFPGVLSRALEIVVGANTAGSGNEESQQGQLQETERAAIGSGWYTRLFDRGNVARHEIFLLAPLGPDWPPIET